MSKKETIEDRVKLLLEREDQIKRQLESHSDELKSKAEKVGKMALTSGVVVLAGYWIFNTFFRDEEEIKPASEKEQPKATKPSVVSSRIIPFALPYIGKLLDRVLEKKEDQDS